MPEQKSTKALQQYKVVGKTLLGKQFNQALINFNQEFAIFCVSFQSAFNYDYYVLENIEISTLDSKFERGTTPHEKQHPTAESGAEGTE